MLNETFYLLIALIALVIATGIAIYFWKKATGLYSLLVEGANRYEELRTQSQNQNAMLDKVRAELSSKDQDYRDSELQVTAMSRKQTDWQQQLVAKENELDHIRNKLELQRDYVEKEWRQAQADRDQARQELEETQRQASETSNDLLGKEAAARLQAEQAVARSQSQLQKVTKEKEELSRKFGKLSVEDIIRLRRKATHYEKLYNTMKGLRELAEERATNWETGARKLAAYTLAQQQKLSSELENGPVGPLVTTALRLIGAQLIDDDEDASEALPSKQQAAPTQPRKAVDPTTDQHSQNISRSEQNDGPSMVTLS